MDTKSFIGTWEILGYKYNNEKEFNVVDLKGVLFKLEENGDVVWTISPDLSSVPLFACEIYEVYNINDLGYIIRFGTYGGHILEFKCDDALPDEGITLTLKEWCKLHCKKVVDESQEKTINTTFSLLPALQEKFFTDLTITASESIKINCHSIIVKLLANEIPWESQIFSQQPAFVVEALLYYLYTESLPDKLTEDDCRALINFGKEYSCLCDFVDKCQLYTKKLNLTQTITVLINDMQTYITCTIGRFECIQKDSRQRNPSDLNHIVKESIKDGIIVGTKLAYFCDLYIKRKSELTKNEQNQIIRLTRYRLPIFMNQIRKLFEVISNSFGSLRADEKEELAKHLVPEYEDILQKTSKVIRAVGKAIKEVIVVLSPLRAEMRWISPFNEVLDRSLENILSSRELHILEEFYDHINCGFELILRKSDYFRGMSEDFKVRSVVYTLNEIVEELPIFVLRLEKVIDDLDEKLEWRDFKFCFKVGTSQVASIVQKLIRHRASLENLFENFAGMVDRDVLTKSLVDLGLLNKKFLQQHHSESKLQNLKKQPEAVPEHMFNLLESICRFPTPSHSFLSKQCLELFRNEVGVDMEFEVIVSGSLEDVIDDGSEQPESYIFRAHRIIMAARCYWFRRALLCDMKEAIDRKIVIHDTNPYIFRIFLEFLYCGDLDHNNLSMDQLVELLLLSDRYEVDSLKQVCEYKFEAHMDDESVLYLFNVSDQCNAKILKNNCINYLLKNNEITDGDGFLDLPVTLQNEVFDQMWSFPSSQKLTNKQYDFPKGEISNNSNFQLAGIESRHFNECMIQLRDIVGIMAPEDQLIHATLAANCDVFKAVNVFYGRI